MPVPWLAGSTAMLSSKNPSSVTSDSRTPMMTPGFGNMDLARFDHLGIVVKHRCRLHSDAFDVLKVGSANASRDSWNVFFPSRPDDDACHALIAVTTTAGAGMPPLFT